MLEWEYVQNLPKLSLDVEVQFGDNSSTISIGQTSDMDNSEQ